MSSRSGGEWITFNGEIYNYVELREQLRRLGHQFTTESDTEVLLAAYSEWGIDCLSKLRGMFAFALWDVNSKCLTLARDRCGEKPLYYWQNENEVLFASELRALLAMLPVRPEIDPQAFDLFLHYQYVPEPATPLVGVYKLPAAHSMVTLPGRHNHFPKPYWTISNIQPIDADPVPLVRTELEKAIELTLRSDVPVGVALSGGIDSNAIAALAARRSREQLYGFTVGYPGEPPVDERHYARSIAKSLGITLHEAELDTREFIEQFPALVAHSDDPVADIAAFGHYMVARTAADQGIKVLLTGIGGDELFWGYEWLVRAAALTEQKRQCLLEPDNANCGRMRLWSRLSPVTTHSMYRRIARSRRIPNRLRRLMTSALDASAIDLNYPEQAVFVDLTRDFSSARTFAADLYTRHARSVISERNAFAPFEIPGSPQDTPIDMYRLLFETWLVSNCLALGDRLSMACSVETRMPLLDSGLIELVIGLSKTHAHHKVGHKGWLRSALKGSLPDEVLNRPKRGFEPPSIPWMQGAVDRYCGILRDGVLVSENLVRGDFVERLQRRMSVETLFLTYKLVVFEMWYRNVVLANVGTATASDSTNLLVT